MDARCSANAWAFSVGLLAPRCRVVFGDEGKVLWRISSTWWFSSGRSGVRLCRKDWTQSFPCRRRSCLRSRVARLRDLLFSGVLKCCHHLRSCRFSSRRCLMKGGQLWV
jgi:hypothetical protein